MTGKSSRALKQLTTWVTSQSRLWLIVEVEGAFDVFYTGYLRQLTPEEDLFYVEPIEGGGVFQVSASQCSSIATIRGGKGLIFSDGKSVNLKLLGCLPTDPINRAGQTSSGAVSSQD